MPDYLLHPGLFPGLAHDVVDGGANVGSRNKAFTPADVLALKRRTAEEWTDDAIVRLDAHDRVVISHDCEYPYCRRPSERDSQRCERHQGLPWPRWSL